MVIFNSWLVEFREVNGLSTHFPFFPNATLYFWKHTNCFFFVSWQFLLFYFLYLSKLIGTCFAIAGMFSVGLLVKAECCENVIKITCIACRCPIWKQSCPYSMLPTFEVLCQSWETWIMGSPQHSVCLFFLSERYIELLASFYQKSGVRQVLNCHECFMIKLVDRVNPFLKNYTGKFTVRIINPCSFETTLK
jgi:hypothetical protein